MKFVAILFLCATLALSDAGLTKRSAADSAVQTANEKLSALKQKLEAHLANGHESSGLHLLCEYALRMVNRAQAFVESDGPAYAAKANEFADNMSKAMDKAAEAFGAQVANARARADAIIAMLKVAANDMAAMWSTKSAEFRSKGSEFLATMYDSLISQVKNLSTQLSEQLDKAPEHWAKMVETYHRIVKQIMDAISSFTGGRREARDAQETVDKVVAATKEQLSKLKDLFEEKLAAAKEARNHAAIVLYHTGVSMLRSMAFQVDQMAQTMPQKLESALKTVAEGIRYLEDLLMKSESRDALEKVMSGFEIVKLVIFRTKQLVSCIEETARHMTAQGHPEVGERLMRVAESMVSAKAKLTDLISQMSEEQRTKISAAVQGALDVVDTALGIVAKIPLIKVKGIEETKAIVAGLQSLVDAFKGNEVVQGDQKALEEILSVTGVPDVIKVCRSVFTFLSKFLRLIGQGNSKVNDYINQSVQTIDATLEVYADAVNSAGEVAHQSWKDTAQQVKDKFLGLFKKK